MVCRAGVSGPVFAVDQKNVGKSVIVVIDESAAGAHGFRKILFPERAIVVGEVDAGIVRDIVKLNSVRARG